MVGVEVPVVVVVEVVVAKGEKPENLSSFTYITVTAASNVRPIGLPAVAAVFHGRKNNGTMKGRVALKLPSGHVKIRKESFYQ